MSMRGNPTSPSDPRLTIAAGLVNPVRATLSPEQAARYQKEIGERTAARQRVVLLNLVAKFDQLLILTPEQRVKLGDILKNNWDEAWNQTQLLTLGIQYLPQVPEVKVLPLLTENQKNVWRTVTTRNIRFGFNPGIVQEIAIEDEVWDDERPQQKPDSEKK